MSEDVLIEVSSALKGKPQAAARHVQDLLSQAGLEGVVLRKVSNLYRLRGELSLNELMRIAGELLCDAVAERFTIDHRPQDDRTLFADVWYRPGVTDAAADSVLKAIRDLNIATVREAATGTRYEFQLSRASARAADPDPSMGARIASFIADRLLNPLVQECKIQQL